MEEPFVRRRRSWLVKFVAAFRGWRLGTRGQNAFFVHFPAGMAVVGAAAGFRVTATEWCLLLLCITIVLAAELFNSALETMARAVTQTHHEAVGQALDIASGAVLLAACGAAVAGLIILLPRLIALVF